MAGPLSASLKSGGKDLVKELNRRLAPAVGKYSDFIAERAEGTYVWTTDGQKHLDMACGIGVASTGHCHPKVVKAIQDQTQQFIIAQQNIFTASPAMVGLLDRLGRIVPKGLDTHIFANSGSEVVENAIKMARAHTKKTNIICFDGAFHGRTMGAMALTSSKTFYKTGFAPLMPGAFIAPFPYCLHCKVRQTASDGKDWYKMSPSIPPFDEYEARRCCRGPHDAFKWMLKMQTAPEDTAAIIIEPILGEGGFVAPPPDFLSTLRKHCDEHNIVMIIDEVQSGVARTGKWWAHQHFKGVVPDIMLFAKGIASGFPFAGIAAKPEMYQGLPTGSLGGTYGGSIIGCAAANATIDAIEEDGMLDNARERGLQLIQGLLELSKKYPIIDVRGRGLMVAVEFGEQRSVDGSYTAKAGCAAAVTKAAQKRNMILLTAGARECIRFLPPLNVKAAEIDEALEKLEGSLQEVFKSDSKTG
ncbi:hypothetical protein WJX77_010196 [Trebouxia sp. C0004]